MLGDTGNDLAEFLCIALARTSQIGGFGEKSSDLWFEEVKVVGAWERTETRWTLIRGSARSERNFSLRLYSGTELAALLLRSGFGEAAIYGNLAARPYDQDAERLVAVAKK